MDQGREPRTKHRLSALTGAEWQRWQPRLECVDLTLGQVLYKSGAPQSHVYFPTSAIVSLLYLTESGASAEIAIVGNERRPTGPGGQPLPRQAAGLRLLERRAGPAGAGGCRRPFAAAVSGLPGGAGSAAVAGSTGAVPAT